MPVDVAKFVITHELTHIILGDTVRKLVPDLPHIRSFNPINEAITQLVAHPPRVLRNQKVKQQITWQLFWDKWQHYIQNLESYNTFEDFLTELFTLLSKQAKTLKI